jgi:hypothetical protein
VEPKVFSLAAERLVKEKHKITNPLRSLLLSGEPERIEKLK